MVYPHSLLVNPLPLAVTYCRGVAPQTFFQASSDMRRAFRYEAEIRGVRLDNEWYCASAGGYFLRDELLITDDMQPQCPKCYEAGAVIKGWHTVYPRLHPPLWPLPLANHGDLLS
jgi:hypothetical protein